MAPLGGMKLKLNTAGASQSNGANAPSATPNTPSIKFNLPSKSATATPQSAKAAKSDSRKRQRAANDDGEEGSSVPKKKTAKLPSLVTKKAGILKLSGVGSPKTPTSAGLARLKIKGKGKPPARPFGVGYDSEAEDAEEDPAIEENVVLRMQAGPDCDYLRHAIENRTIGLSTAQGGADVYMRFFKQRRATIVIRGSHYAAVLLDLPCIVESLKSWDKRGWWKSADICQILYVFARVSSETEAERRELPGHVDQKTWLWPHGLTPPLYNVRKRRFRQRVSYRTIEAAEDEVQRLLDLDSSARAIGGDSNADVVDLDRLRSLEAESDEEDEDDADGEAEFDFDEDEEDDEAVANRMALELGGDDFMAPPEAPTPANTAGIGVVETPSGSAAPTPAAQDAAEAGDKSAESSDEDEDDEDDEEEGEDEEERERAHMLTQQREEIAHLQSQIDQTKTNIASTTNPLIVQRMQRRIETLEKELMNKKRSIGEVDDDDDDA